MTAPSHEEAVQRLERLADRLRVVGPRLAAREGEQAQQTLREIRAGLQRLADLAADAAGEPRRAVPTLAGHALADQALVLGYDVLGSAPATSDRTSGHGSDQASPEEAARAAAAQIVVEIYELV